MIKRSALVVALVVALLGVSTPARAMVPTDPWVPPSVVSHDGLADPAMALGGVHVPLATADPRDVHVEAIRGSICTRSLTGWHWTGETLDVDVLAHDWSYCYGNDLAAWYVTFGCIVTTRWYDIGMGRFREVGEPLQVRDAGTWASAWGTTTTRTLSNFQCEGPAGSGAVFWVDFALDNDSMSTDGLRTYVPGVAATVRPAVTALTTCSDGSTVTSTAASGADVVPAACVTGSLVSVTLLSGPAEVGHVGIGTPWRGNPCLSGAGVCSLIAGGAGDPAPCANTDPYCVWWSGTDAATSCNWRDGGGALYALANSDCEAARHDGFMVPGGQASPSPTPTPGDPGADKVTQAVRDMAASVGSALNGIGQTVHDIAAQNLANWEHAIAAVEAIPGAITRAVVPDASVMSGLGARAKAALGAPLAGWSTSLGDMAGAWAATSGSCQGPTLRMPVFGSFWEFHPLDACSGYGLMLAPIIHLGATVLLLWEGAWACTRNVAGGLGFNA